MKASLRVFGNFLLLAGCILATLILTGFQEPAVQVDPDSGGPRNLEAQTRAAVVRDYLQAWKSMNGALQENRADLLDASFVGIAKEKLTDTVRRTASPGLEDELPGSFPQSQNCFLLSRGIVGPVIRYGSVRSSSHRSRPRTGNSASKHPLRRCVDSDRSSLEGTRFSGAA